MQHSIERKSQHYFTLPLRVARQLSMSDFWLTTWHTIVSVLLVVYAILPSLAAQPSDPKEPRLICTPEFSQWPLSVLVLQLSSRGDRDSSDESAFVLLKWAHKHGYDFKVERCGPPSHGRVWNSYWAKPGALRRNLFLYDVVIAFESDSLVHDFSLTVIDLLAYLRPGTSILVSNTDTLRQVIYPTSPFFLFCAAMRPISLPLTERRWFKSVSWFGSRLACDRFVHFCEKLDGFFILAGPVRSRRGLQWNVALRRTDLRIYFDCQVPGNRDSRSHATYI